MSHYHGNYISMLLQAHFRFLIKFSVTSFIFGRLHQLVMREFADSEGDDAHFGSGNKVMQRARFHSTAGCIPIQSALLIRARSILLLIKTFFATHAQQNKSRLLFWGNSYFIFEILSFVWCVTVEILCFDALAFHVSIICCAPDYTFASLWWLTNAKRAIVYLASSLERQKYRFCLGATAAGGSNFLSTCVSSSKQHTTLNKNISTQRQQQQQQQSLSQTKSSSKKETNAGCIKS